MRNRWCVCLTLLAAVIAMGSVSAAPADEKEVRKELQAWYEKIVDTYRADDLRSYLALFSPDFKQRDFRGKTMGVKELRAFAKGDMAAIGEIHSAEWEITKLTMKGNEAHLSVVETWKYLHTDLKGEYGPKGKTYDVVWTAPSKGIIVKTPRGWLAKTREATGPDKLTVGGKPLVPLAELKKKGK